MKEFEIKETHKNFIKNFLNKVENKNANEEDVLNFVKFFMHMYKNAVNPNNEIKVPDVVFTSFGSYEHTSAEYDQRNIIKINQDIIDKLNKEDSLVTAFDLIKTIAHEMTHWTQKDTLVRLDEMQESQKEQISDYVSNVVLSYKNDQVLEGKDLQIFHKVLCCYLKDGAMFLPTTYNKIAYSMYYLQDAEKDARDVSIQFVDLVFSQVKDLISKQNSEKVFNFLQESKTKENNAIDKNKQILEQYIGKFKFSLDDVKILEKKYEKESALIFSYSTYYTIISEIIKNSSMEEKLDILKHGLMTDNYELITISLNSISSDKNFIENKHLYQDRIIEHVIEGAKQNGGIVTYDFSIATLNSKQIKDVFYKTLEELEDVVSATYFLLEQYNSKVSFTNEEIYDLEEKVMFGEIELDSSVAPDFYNAIFSNKKLPEKIEMLKGDEIKSNQFTRSLISSIVHDKDYAKTSYINKKSIQKQIEDMGFKAYYISLQDKNKTNINAGIER